jgi:hypothetical protein
MNEKADITLSWNEGGKLVVTPDPFVLRKDATWIRIYNDSDTEIELNLKEAPVDEDALRIAARAFASITVKRSVSEGLYGYEVSVAPPVRRSAALEASPRIMVAEASPKIIVEASPKIIAEGASHA